MSGEFLMGYPQRTSLRPLPQLRPRRARPRITSVVNEVFAEFLRAVERGDPHEPQGLVDRPIGPIPPKTPPSETDLRLSGRRF